MVPHLHLLANTMGVIAWGFVYVMLRPGLQARGFSAHAQALLAPQMFRFLGLIALFRLLLQPEVASAPARAYARA